MVKQALLLMLLLSLSGLPSLSLAQAPVFLNDMTWMEVRDAIDAGKTTVIIPSGGTEQNGPHMIIGKHHYLVSYTSAEIARRLGNALVAPVLDYVPEGSVEDPQFNMLYPGTITLPQEYFEKVTEYAARSLALHGFTHIVLLGDKSGNQAGLANVANLLNDEWAGTGIRVLHASHYYANPNIDPVAVEAFLQEHGLVREQLGGNHANFGDTAQLMYVHPEGIRTELIQAGTWDDGNGVNGDPTAATPEAGEFLVNGRINAAVLQIEAFVREN